MIEIKKDNISKAFELLESGINTEKVLAMFPQEKQEIEELILLTDSIRNEKNKIEPPKELLRKILQENRISNEVIGRSSMQEIFNKIINNLNFMNQKLKISISIVGVIAVFIIGITIFKSNKNVPVTTMNQNSPSVTATKIATITPVIGNKEVDTSINETLDEVLNETNLDAEMASVDLALADEDAFNQINNLVNDNEL
jgi:hypothetical protein